MENNSYNYFFFYSDNTFDIFIKKLIFHWPIVRYLLVLEDISIPLFFHFKFVLLLL